MVRRVVALLLLPFVLLTQSAPFSHTHGGSQPAGHDLRPHIHLSLDSAGPDDGHHHHGPGGHHHRHDAGDDCLEPETLPTPRPEPLSDHDSDAFYITGVDALVNDRPATDEDLTTSVYLASVGPDLFAHSWSYPPSESGYWTHPPPATARSCPLYVRYRALLN